MVSDYLYRIKSIDKVYDGDTITVTIDLGFGVYKTQKIRLYGINTPELRGDERIEGLKSRDYLRDIIEVNWGQVDFYLKSIKDRTGKYGRYLGILYINDIDINNQLLEEGYAKEYGR